MSAAFSCSAVALAGARAAPALDAKRGIHRVLRRRRRARAGVDAASSSAAGEGEEKGVAGSDDAEASDLALPSLKALFAGAGDPNCEQCGGRGETGCAVCNATGFIKITMMDTVSSSQCRLCRGRRCIPCPTCRKEVYKTVLWWDLIPSKEEDPEENWRTGPDGEPRIRWTDNPGE